MRISNEPKTILRPRLYHQTQLGIYSSRRLAVCVGLCYGLWASVAQALDPGTVFSRHAEPATVESKGVQLPFPDVSLLENKLSQQHALSENPFGIAFYEENYILPFYYTRSPAQGIYRQIFPAGSPWVLKPKEFAGKMSVVVPLGRPFLSHKISAHVSYTQSAFWQVYTPSPYFRETNYEPQVFLRYPISRSWLLDAGLNHSSNGRGSYFERSWNRFFLHAHFSGSRWLVDIKPWFPIWQYWDMDTLNPDIVHYLGHERIRAAYHWKGHTWSLTVSNVESGFRRGSQQLDWVFPLTSKLHLMAHFFHGYGQSLIEYRHKTWGAGLGFSLNPY